MTAPHRTATAVPQQLRREEDSRAPSQDCSSVSVLHFAAQSLLLLSTPKQDAEPREASDTPRMGTSIPPTFAKPCLENEQHCRAQNMAMGNKCGSPAYGATSIPGAVPGLGWGGFGRALPAWRRKVLCSQVLTLPQEGAQIQKLPPWG